MFMELQTAIRVITALTYMDTRKSAIWNILYMIIFCIAVMTLPSNHPMSRPIRIQLGVCEFASCLMITALSAFLESYLLTLVRTNLQVEDAWNAVDTFVSGFCDAMVTLDAGLQIKTASPKYEL